MIKTKRTIELEEENTRLQNEIDSLNRKLEWYEVQNGDSTASIF